MPPDVQTGAPGSAAAPAAPAAGSAAAAPRAPAAPQGTKDVIEQARRALAETGTMLPEPEADEAAAPGAPAAEAVAEAAPEGEQSAAAEERAPGEQPQEIVLTTGEGEAAKEVRIPVADPEAFAALSEALAPEPDHDDLVVKLPGLSERGEGEYEFEMPDAEGLERLRRLQNNARVGEQVKVERRALDRQQERIESFMDALDQDPVGVLLERTKPEDRSEVVWNALLTPGVLEALEQRLQREEIEGGLPALMENPALLRSLRAEAALARKERADRVSAAASGRRAEREVAQRVSSQVEQLLPAHLSGDARDRAFDGALAAVRETLGGMPGPAVKAELVAAVVSLYLREQGIAAETVGSGNGNGKPSAAQPPAAPARTAKDFQQAAAARRTAAAAAPAGAGALPSKARPALPSTTKDRIAFLREHGLKVLGGT